MGASRCSGHQPARGCSCCRSVRMGRRARPRGMTLRPRPPGPRSGAAARRTGCPHALRHAAACPPTCPPAAAAAARAHAAAAAAGDAAASSASRRDAPLALSITKSYGEKTQTSLLAIPNETSHRSRAVIARIFKTNFDNCSVTSFKNFFLLSFCPS
jgi:hypothetical protein